MTCPVQTQPRSTPIPPIKITHGEFTSLRWYCTRESTFAHELEQQLDTARVHAGTGVCVQEHAPVLSVLLRMQGHKKYLVNLNEQVAKKLVHSVAAPWLRDRRWRQSRPLAGCVHSCKQHGQEQPPSQ